jgi:hypothetical protein
MSSISQKPVRRSDLPDAEARHAATRADAGQVAAEMLLEEEGVQLLFRPITWRDVAVGDTWTYGGYAPGWSWAKALVKFRRRPRRVEAAVCVERVGQAPALCGLILGRISNGHVVASIQLMSRAPAPNPLEGRFTRIAVRYLEFCAKAEHCEIVALLQPIPDLVDYYKKLGFRRQYVKKGVVVLFVHFLTVSPQSLC